MTVMDPPLAPPTLPPAQPQGPPSKPPAPLEVHSTHAAITIPGDIRDLAGFRAWAHSDDFPQQGRFAFLDGLLWVDLSMEEIFTHSQVKGAAYATIREMVRAEQLGYLLLDGALLSIPVVNLATEPDLLFCLYQTIASGRARFVPGKKAGYMEIEGSPDMALEIVSASSVKKDKTILPPLYWKAGVPEFWLIDARQTPVEFQILRHGPEAYVPQSAGAHGIFSPLFNRHFKLTQTADRFGHPEFILEAHA
ncbi:MAG: Uma2 family endonuclease [Gemmataceae bacterium]